MFSDIYKNRRVLVTGHTGFKGSWLCKWLELLGAEVCGIALPMPEEPSHSSLLKQTFRSELFDIRDSLRLENTFASFKPEIVFHLAAQPLVRASYRDPVGTFEVNAVGTAKVLDACVKCESVRAALVVTSDKCYENIERPVPYNEGDRMGGFDPYSASKGCAELVTSSMRRSFVPPEEYGIKHHLLIASARAGNVIGGGDWAEDRLVPDIMRAAAQGRTTLLRNPSAIRPWQHVLEPLGGYLLLAERLFEGKTSFASAWNFGPSQSEKALTVLDAANAIASGWDAVKLETAQTSSVSAAPHEAGILMLDCSKALRELAWAPVWDSHEAFRRTAEWYRMFYTRNVILTEKDIADYSNSAASKGF